MKSNSQGSEPVQNLRQRFISPLLIYLLVGLSGIGVSIFLDANPVVETIFLLIAGFLIGTLIEKVIKNTSR